RRRHTRFSRDWSSDVCSSDLVGEISDDACAMLRKFIIDAFGFDPKAENVRDAVTQLCLEHTFHPIRQMLASLLWDEIPRVDEWQIGRASCRERGEGWVGAGPM